MFRTVTAQIVSTVALTFIVYLMIGLPLAVLPPYVHDRLGFGSFLSGLTISVQYLATLANRPQAGRMADTSGPKRTVLLGLATGAASGAFLLLASILAATPSASLASLLVSRLLLGFGESWVGTGAISGQSAASAPPEPPRDFRRPPFLSRRGHDEKASSSISDRGARTRGADGFRAGARTRDTVDCDLLGRGQDWLLGRDAP